MNNRQGRSTSRQTNFGGTQSRQGQRSRSREGQRPRTEQNGPGPYNRQRRRDSPHNPNTNHGALTEGVYMRKPPSLRDQLVQARLSYSKDIPDKTPSGGQGPLGQLMQQPELQVLSQNEQEWRNYLLLHRKTVYHEVQPELPELQSDLLPEGEDARQLPSKTHSCTYCGQIKQNMGRHLELS